MKTNSACKNILENQIDQIDQIKQILNSKPHIPCQNQETCETCQQVNRINQNIAQKALEKINGTVRYTSEFFEHYKMYIPNNLNIQNNINFDFYAQFDPYINSNFSSNYQKFCNYIFCLL